MVKALLKLACSAVLLLLLSLAGIGAWLIGTTAGAKVLLATLSSTAALQIEVDSLSGRFADALRLDGVRVRWPGGALQTPTLLLRWQPLQLLSGRLTLEELSLGEVMVDLLPDPVAAAGQERTPPLRWPSVTGFPRHIDATLESLHVAGIKIDRPDAAPLLFGAVSLRLDWQDGRLHSSRIDAQSPYGRMTGEMTAGLVSPAFSARLHGELADKRRIALALDLTAGSEKELLAGPLTCDLSGGREGEIHLAANLGLATDAVELRDLVLTRAAAGGAVHGRIRYRFDAAARPLNLDLRLANLDLSPETGMSTALSGRLAIEGGPEAYAGDFALQNNGKGWRSLDLGGHLAGNRQSLTLTELAGHLLHGSLRGALRLDWTGPLALDAALQGTSLNPGLLAPEMAGAINFSLTSTLRLPAGAPLQLALTARLQESRLRGHPLRGEIDAELRDHDLRLRRLELQGDGIAVSAKGRLQERIDFTLAVKHLEGLLPGANGSATASGWLRRQNGEIAGALDGEGRALAYGGMTLEHGRVHLQRPASAGPFAFRADLSALSYGGRHLQQIKLQGDGLPARHQLRLILNWPQGELMAAGDGGYKGGSWSGKILQLQGEESDLGAWRLAAPVHLTAAADSLRFSPLELASPEGEHLEIAGAFDFAKRDGEITAQWDDLILDRANFWLTGMHLEGATSGALQGRWGGDDRLELRGKVVAAGRLEQGRLRMGVQRLAADFSWDNTGLQSRWDLALSAGGTLSGTLTSPEPGRLAPPGRLSLQLDGEGFALETLAPWLPPTLNLSGKLAGNLKAELFPDSTLNLSGAATIDNGLLSWTQKKGKMLVPLRSAALTWRWQQQALRLDLDCVLADYGRITGKVALPLPAILPLAIIPDGTMTGELKGDLKEQGLLSALLPGLLRESRGDLQLDLRLGGSWQSPALAGNVTLSGAGAYLPAAGIEVHDLSLHSEFSGDRVRLLALEMASGEGKIKGEGELRLQNWVPGEFRATVTGERFLAINLPELRLAINPALTLSGTPQDLKLRGEIKIPELLVRGRQTPAPLRQHADVIILDTVTEEAPGPPLALDLELRLLLGERVLVNFGGIDARLAGDIVLNARHLDEIKGRGEIHVAEGSYAAYGMKLEVERGTLLFAGGPVDQPTLDVLALRRAGEIKAGVRVSGTPREPRVKLYSEPAMPDTDILSYIVFGRPMGSDTGQADLLLVAAGALLRKGESTVLQDRLRRRVGLDVLDIQAGNGDVTTSMITVGKYLNPRLYISLGYALFTGSNIVGIRYNITDRWQAESTVGEESGVDLYYQIEFH